jgi:hypothetical protein
MGEHKFSFGPAELRYISITCPGCKTRITFDIAETTGRVKDQCPFCQTVFPNLNRMLNDYREFHRNAVAEGYDVRLVTEGGEGE